MTASSAASVSDRDVFQLRLYASRHGPDLLCALLDVVSAPVIKKTYPISNINA